MDSDSTNNLINQSWVMHAKSGFREKRKGKMGDFRADQEYASFFPCYKAN